MQLSATEQLEVLLTVESADRILLNLYRELPLVWKRPIDLKAHEKSEALESLQYFVAAFPRLMSFTFTCISEKMFMQAQAMYSLSQVQKYLSDTQIAELIVKSGRNALTETIRLYLVASTDNDDVLEEIARSFPSAFMDALALVKLPEGVPQRISGNHLRFKVDEYEYAGIYVHQGAYFETLVPYCALCLMRRYFDVMFAERTRYANATFIARFV